MCIVRRQKEREKARVVNVKFLNLIKTVLFPQQHKISIFIELLNLYAPPSSLMSESFSIFTNFLLPRTLFQSAIIVRAENSEKR